MKITISKENYLKAIAEAESEGETVKAATLSRWLNVTAPAVTMAIKRLKRDVLIRVDEDGHITLTSAGREIANRILNRHHLIERMLTEIFGMEWYKVHDEAEQLEHAVSGDFERRLVEKLGAGESCPHGNRVGVDTPADRRRRGLKTLDESCGHRSRGGHQRVRARPAAAGISGRLGSAARFPGERGMPQCRRHADPARRRPARATGTLGRAEGVGAGREDRSQKTEVGMKAATPTSVFCLLVCDSPRTCRFHRRLAVGRPILAAAAFQAAKPAKSRLRAELPAPQF